MVLLHLAQYSARSGSGSPHVGQRTICIVGLFSEQPAKHSLSTRVSRKARLSTGVPVGTNILRSKHLLISQHRPKCFNSIRCSGLHLIAQRVGYIRNVILSMRWLTL